MFYKPPELILSECFQRIRLTAPNAFVLAQDLSCICLRGCLQEKFHLGITTWARHESELGRPGSPAIDMTDDVRPELDIDRD